MDYDKYGQLFFEVDNRNRDIATPGRDENLKPLIIAHSYDEQAKDLFWIFNREDDLLAILRTRQKAYIQVDQLSAEYCNEIRRSGIDFDHISLDHFGIDFKFTLKNSKHFCPNFMFYFTLRDSSGRVISTPSCFTGINKKHHLERFYQVFAVTCFLNNGQMSFVLDGRFRDFSVKRNLRLIVVEEMAHYIITNSLEVRSLYDFLKTNYY